LCLPNFQRCHRHFSVELGWRWISVHLVALQQTQIKLFGLFFNSESFRHLMGNRFSSTQEKQHRRRISGQNLSHLLTCRTEFSPTNVMLLMLYFYNVWFQFYSTGHFSSWVTFSWADGLLMESYHSYRTFIVAYSCSCYRALLSINSDIIKLAGYNHRVLHCWLMNNISCIICFNIRFHILGSNVSLVIGVRLQLKWEFSHDCHFHTFYI
jgi:hypothetical protein